MIRTPRKVMNSTGALKGVRKVGVVAQC
jgi:hypothetical protein